MIFEIKDPVHDKRRGLQPILPTRREGPYRHELLDVLALDLIKRAVTPCAVISEKSEPVPRLLFRLFNALRRRLLGGE